MSASTSKFAAKKSTVQARAPKDEPIVNPVVDEALRNYAAAQDDVLRACNVPTGTRFLVATATGLLTYASSMYFGMPLVGLLTMGAITLTGLPFIGLVVWVLGAFTMVLSSLVAGYKTFSYVLSIDFGHVADVGRGVRAHAKRRVSQVRGWFKRSDVVAA
jgi:hypothetical protein